MSMEKVINSYELTGRIGLLRSNKSSPPLERRKCGEVVKKEFPPATIHRVFLCVPRIRLDDNERERGEEWEWDREMTNDSPILSPLPLDKISLLPFLFAKTIKRRRLRNGWSFSKIKLCCKFENPFNENSQKILKCSLPAFEFIQMNEVNSSSIPTCSSSPRPHRIPLQDFFLSRNRTCTGIHTSLRSGAFSPHRTVSNSVESNQSEGGRERRS